MKKNTLQIVIACSTILGLFNACSQSDETPTISDTSNAITFSSYVGASTRGPVTYLSDLQENGFMVFANTTADNWAKDGATSTANFMYEQEVRFTDPESTGTSAWHYAPVKFWPREGKVSFFTYSPYANPVRSDYSDMHHSAWDKAGATQLTYRLYPEATHQDDVIAAAALDYDMESHGGKVDFTFQHVLSKIGFAAHCPSTLGQGTTLEITKLNIQYEDGAIRNKAVLNLADVAGALPADLWKDVSEPNRFKADDDNLNAGSLLGDATGAQSSVEINATATSITSKDAYLMLIPQAYNTGDLIVTLSYKLTTKDPNLAQDVVQTVEDKEIKLPAIPTGWLPGKQYTYILSVGPQAVQFDSHIDVSDWDAESILETIPVETPDAPLTDDNIYYLDDVYHIMSAEGLQRFGAIVDGNNTETVVGYTNSATAHIPNTYHANAVLEADIDLSTVCGEALGISWDPIGDSTHAYTGQFDGQNHTISNLYDKRSGEDYYGHALFGATNGATISNVHIRNAQISIPFLGYKVNYVGSLVASARATTFNMCSNQSDVMLAGVYPLSNGRLVGGLLGVCGSCTLINCWSKSNVYSYLEYAGGLIGDINGNVTEPTTLVGCYTISNDILSDDNCAGSLVGRCSAGELHYYGCWANYTALSDETPEQTLVGTFKEGASVHYHNSVDASENTVLNNAISTLNTDIATYNASASQDMQCTYIYTDEGTYGPIWNP